MILLQQDVQQALAVPFFRQRNVQALGESTSCRLVQFLRAIGGTNDEDAALPAGPRPVELHQELGLDTSTGLILVRLSLRQERVNFVDKAHGGFTVGGHSKHCAHQLFALANPFAGQRRARDGKEGRTRLVGNGFANQGLARSCTRL